MLFNHDDTGSSASAGLDSAGAADTSGVKVYRLPPATPEDAEKALRSQSLLYELVPAASLPKGDSIAYFVAAPGDGTPPHIVINSDFSGLIDNFEKMSNDARRSLLRAAIDEVSLSGAAGPGWAAQYKLFSEFLGDCKNCSPNAAMTIDPVTDVAAYLLGHHIALKLEPLER